MRFACFLAALVWAAGFAVAEPAYIRVATFNIAKFGAGEEYTRSLVSLVNILNEIDADLICLQEINPKKAGYEQTERLVRLLNTSQAYYKKPLYSFAVASRYSGGEAPGYIWRRPVELLSEIGTLNVPRDPDRDGKPTFQRVPGLALFRAGNYDFYVVNCHLYTQVDGKTSEGRTEELAALSAWLRGLAAGPERDALVLGDFNRFLNGKQPWQRFLAPGYERAYRVPLLEAIQDAAPGFDPVNDEAPLERFSTTTSAKRSIYDLIVVSAGSYREHVAKPKFGIDVGIVNFDLDRQYEWFVRDWQLATNILTDHKPVWIRMRIDLPDDD
jgi:endonuclease/exonuclease/phosphatase family metal-dependent hydrolase